MAFSFNNGGRGGGSARRGPAPMAEINVTPFVDVVLVLLIIFMLTAHLTEYGMEVEVPKTRSVVTSTKDLPVVTITKTGETFLGKQPVNINLLARRIHEKYAGQDAVFVRADRETPYDPIAQVISELGAAKLAVSLVTQPIDSAPSGHH